jgi:hypothetical protein
VLNPPRTIGIAVGPRGARLSLRIFTSSSARSAIFSRSLGIATPIAAPGFSPRLCATLPQTQLLNFLQHSPIILILFAFIILLHRRREEVVSRVVSFGDLLFLGS